MTEKERVRLYDKYQTMPLSSTPSYDLAFSMLIRYHAGLNGIIRDNRESKDRIDIEKNGYIIEILPSFEKAKKKASPEALLSLCNYIYRTKSFPSYYVPELISLVFNHEDCFNFEEMTLDKAKTMFNINIRIIDYLVSTEGYHLDEDPPEFVPIVYAHEAQLLYNSDKYRTGRNPFLEEVIAYCIWKGYDKDKFLKMLCYSFDHKDEIYEYVILNNLFDDIRFERFLSVMGKIEEGLNNIQEIR